MKVITGTKSCGCLVAISLYNTEKTKREYQRLGYEVKVMELEEAKRNLKYCNCIENKENDQ